MSKYSTGLLVELTKNLEEFQISDSFITAPINTCKCSLCWRGPSKTKSQVYLSFLNPQYPIKRYSIPEKQ